MPAERTIHVVDDDAAIRRSLEQLLDAIRAEPPLARPIEKIGEMEVRDLFERMAILWSDIEHLTTRDELRLIIPYVPAISRRNDHDLTELMIVNGEAILRDAWLDGDDL